VILAVGNWQGFRGGRGGRGSRTTTQVSIPKFVSNLLMSLVYLYDFYLHNVTS